ncbi:MAG: alpha/beta hydrolase [Candidatus Acidiferrum sp.]
MIQIVALFLCIVVMGVLLGVVYEILGARRDRRAYPPPGRLVSLGSHRLHLLESGEGSPTIVLEAGLMSTVLSWNELQRELSRSFHVVSYDRAGLGWSDLGPMPRTADRIVEELHTLLERAEMAPPYILVGHSFGGLTMPLFAARYPDEVAGMVLVDPVAPAEWNPPSEHDRKLAHIGAKVCRRAAVLSRIGLIRFVAFLLTTSTGKKLAANLVRLISRGAPADAGSVSSPWFLALPARERDMARIFWVQKKFSSTIASQLENLHVSAALAAEGDSYDKPVAILSAHTSSEHRQNEHAAMAQRLDRGIHVIARKSNHWIMQEEPELVISAIDKVVEGYLVRSERRKWETPLTA